jgi:ribosome-associated translation inhibitor RaiA
VLALPDGLVKIGIWIENTRASVQDLGEVTHAPVSSYPTRQNDRVRDIELPTSKMRAWVERYRIFRMQFMLTGAGLAISNQLRAYAKYRFFTSIARYATGVGAVHVALRLEGGVYRCTAAIELASFGPLTIQAQAPHPNAAIERVADGNRLR